VLIITVGDILGSVLQVAFSLRHPIPAPLAHDILRADTPHFNLRRDRVDRIVRADIKEIPERPSGERRILTEANDPELPESD
jgi:hypothetical protein